MWSAKLQPGFALLRPVSHNCEDINPICHQMEQEKKKKSRQVHKSNITTYKIHTHHTYKHAYTSLALCHYTSKSSVCWRFASEFMELSLTQPLAKVRLDIKWQKYQHCYIILNMTQLCEIMSCITARLFPTIMRKNLKIFSPRDNIQ